MALAALLTCAFLAALEACVASLHAWIVWSVVSFGLPVEVLATLAFSTAFGFVFTVFAAASGQLERLFDNYYDVLARVDRIFIFGVTVAAWYVVPRPWGSLGYGFIAMILYAHHQASLRDAVEWTVGGKGPVRLRLGYPLQLWREAATWQARRLLQQHRDKSKAEGQEQPKQQDNKQSRGVSGRTGQQQQQGQQGSPSRTPPCTPESGAAVSSSSVSITETDIMLPATPPPPALSARQQRRRQAQLLKAAAVKAKPSLHEVLELDKSATVHLARQAAAELKRVACAALRLSAAAARALERYGEKRIIDAVPRRVARGRDGGSGGGGEGAAAQQRGSSAQVPSSTQRNGPPMAAEAGVNGGLATASASSPPQLTRAAGRGAAVAAAAATKRARSAFNGAEPDLLQRPRARAHTAADAADGAGRHGAASTTAAAAARSAHVDGAWTAAAAARREMVPDSPYFNDRGGVCEPSWLSSPAAKQAVPARAAAAAAAAAAARRGHSEDELRVALRLESPSALTAQRSAASSTNASSSASSGGGGSGSGGGSASATWRNLSSRSATGAPAAAAAAAPHGSPPRKKRNAAVSAPAASAPPALASALPPVGAASAAPAGPSSTAGATAAAVAPTGSGAAPLNFNWSFKMSATPSLASPALAPPASSGSTASAGSSVQRRRQRQRWRQWPCAARRVCRTSRRRCATGSGSTAAAAELQHECCSGSRGRACAGALRCARGSGGGSSGGSSALGRPVSAAARVYVGPGISAARFPDEEGEGGSGSCCSGRSRIRSAAASSACRRRGGGAIVQPCAERICRHLRAVYLGLERGGGDRPQRRALELHLERSAQQQHPVERSSSYRRIYRLRRNPLGFCIQPSAELPSCCGDSCGDRGSASVSVCRSVYGRCQRQRRRQPIPVPASVHTATVASGRLRRAALGGQRHRQQRRFQQRRQQRGICSCPCRHLTRQRAVFPVGAGAFADAGGCAACPRGGRGGAIGSSVRVGAGFHAARLPVEEGEGAGGCCCCCGRRVCGAAAASYQRRSGGGNGAVRLWFLSPSTGACAVQLQPQRGAGRCHALQPSNFNIGDRAGALRRCRRRLCLWRCCAERIRPICGRSVKLQLVRRGSAGGGGGGGSIAVFFCCASTGGASAPKLLIQPARELSFQCRRRCCRSCAAAACCTTSLICGGGGGSAGLLSEAIVSACGTACCSAAGIHDPQAQGQGRCRCGRAVSGGAAPPRISVQFARLPLEYVLRPDRPFVCVGSDSIQLQRFVERGGSGISSGGGGGSGVHRAVGPFSPPCCCQPCLLPHTPYEAVHAEVVRGHARWQHLYPAVASKGIESQCRERTSARAAVCGVAQHVLCASVQHGSTC
ncbi:hypothetical protein JKP88DRAFT_254085 [Tribonema minus]|uniref:Uncharacterized protein n=1 Tax=Tribonema minus TaxID=303371 RepID=A0A835Z5L9_9STRA|nr:hypothetical protein JKP88DRAFT_254085 [Tribonema minus]